MPEELFCKETTILSRLGCSDGRTIEGALESLHNRLEAYASACDNAHEILVNSNGNRLILPFAETTELR